MKIPESVVAYKHAQVLSKMVENGGKTGKLCSVSKAAREAGYSDAYVRSGKLQQTRSWSKLVELGLSDDLLLSVHLKGLRATQKRYFMEQNKNGKRIRHVVEVPDNMARQRYLDLAYKIKGKYKINMTKSNKLSCLTDEQLETQITGIISELRKDLKVLN